MIIMELHRTEIQGKVISVNDMVEKIGNLGYEIIERHASNIVAKRK